MDMRRGTFPSGPSTERMSWSMLSIDECGNTVHVSNGSGYVLLRVSDITNVATTDEPFHSRRFAHQAYAQCVMAIFTSQKCFTYFTGASRVR